MSVTVFLFPAFRPLEDPLARAAGHHVVGFSQPGWQQAASSAAASPSYCLPRHRLAVARCSAHDGLRAGARAGLLAVRPASASAVRGWVPAAVGLGVALPAASLGHWACGPAADALA